MKEEQALEEISKELEIGSKQGDHSFAKQIVIQRINELIEHDFQKLVSILYRADVSETKLKQLLTENPATDAALIITELLVERQLQKIRFRQEYRSDENISDEEKW
jgi:hypothetical protein